MKHLVLVSAAIFLSACAAAPPADAPRADVWKADVAPVAGPAAWSDEGPFIRLYETPCFFTCPTYEFTLKPNGAYRLINIRDTDRDGETYGDLGPDAWTKAQAALARANFDALPAKVQESRTPSRDRPPCINDLPAIEVTRRTADGAELKVHHNTGCNLPEAMVLRDDLRALFDYRAKVRAPR